VRFFLEPKTVTVGLAKFPNTNPIDRKEVGRDRQLEITAPGTCGNTPRVPAQTPYRSTGSYRCRF
jgi:hypothetical protein